MVKPSEYHVQRRPDGAVVVRVVSPRREHKPPLPDAVFCFQIGDPQYDYWASKLRSAQSEAVQCFE
jgi:hypothetical protein